MGHDNDVGLDGCLALGDALTYNFSLSSLSMNSNRTLGTFPAQALIRAAVVKTKKWRGFTNLSLSDCNIGPIACANLAKLLALPRSPLEVLDISGNNIGAEGLTKMCEGLKAAPALTTLNIRECGLGFLASVHPTRESALPGAPEMTRDESADRAIKDCMIAFKNALQDNKKLVNVNMANNGVREQAIGILQPVLASGHIQSFNVDVTLPLPMFEEMFKVPKPVKEKKGKKKKK